MSDKVTSKFKCTNCGREFENEIFSFNSSEKRDSEVFSSCDIVGLSTECPYCHQLTGCNKSNMIFDERNGEGQVFREEGKDTF